MRLKLNIQVLLFALLLTGTTLVLWASQPAATGAGSDRESLEESCKKEEKGGKMIWENLPNQFFSAF
ncbi:MAG: hypothetical protein KA821_11840 [Chitinophagaceae bacterium]|nr:hypothetical protein [Chitinophagaceae bacterium]